ncbi:hypothetical protein ACFWZ2_38775 [Streptomyces sp. NPDC059002]|uniref:hypothetical protein n=1 Tax=Streptomyces sp. NPDC059002 TaxID=3346690 RepID=UPI0036A61DA7
MEELQAETAELALRLEKGREDLSRWEITRETVVLVLAELSAAEAEPVVLEGLRQQQVEQSGRELAAPRVTALDSIGRRPLLLTSSTNCR